MRLLPLAMLAAFSRLALAQPGLTVGPCSQLDAYRSAIALHKSWETKACVGDDADECADQRAAVATLTDLAARCQAGENLGPPPTQFAPARPPGAPRATPIDVTFEGLAGGALALADSSWRRSIGPTPTFAARFGGARGPIGVVASAEVSLEQLNDSNAIAPSPTNEQSMLRARFLAHVNYELRPTPGLAIDARAGLGVDYVSVSINHGQNGAPTNEQASDTGLAVELGGAAWWSVGPALEVGGTLALPLAHHATTVQPFAFQYTGTDLEVLVGVRVNARR